MAFRRVAAASVVVAVSVVGAPSAGAVTPIDTGDFSVTMNKPSEGANETQPATNCTAAGQTVTLQQYVDNVVGRWNQQGVDPPAASCTMTRTTTLADALLTGTVVNKTVGNGTMEQKCDMTRHIDISFTLTATVTASGRTVAASSFANRMDGFQACAWAMSFNDAQQSRLSGTVEQTFTFADAGATVECPASFANRASQGTLYCVTVVSNSKVYVVGGSGAFADTGGEGLLSNTDTAPIVIPKVGTVQGASVRATDAVIFLPAVDSTATANSLRLALLKGAKASVRLVSPQPAGGSRSLGIAPDGSSLTKVKAASAPGAKCGITGKTSKKSAVLLPAKKDSDGIISTSITAAQVRAKLSVKAGAKVTLALSCTVGKTTAKSSQSVTVGA